MLFLPTAHSLWEKYRFLSSPSSHRNRCCCCCCYMLFGMNVGALRAMRSSEAALVACVCDNSSPSVFGSPIRLWFFFFSLIIFHSYFIILLLGYLYYTMFVQCVFDLGCRVQNNKKIQNREREEQPCVARQKASKGRQSGGRAIIKKEHTKNLTERNTHSLNVNISGERRALSCDRRPNTVDILCTRTLYNVFSLCVYRHNLFVWQTDERMKWTPMKTVSLLVFFFWFYRSFVFFICCFHCFNSMTAMFGDFDEIQFIPENGWEWMKQIVYLPSIVGSIPCHNSDTVTDRVVGEVRRCGWTQEREIRFSPSVNLHTKHQRHQSHTLNSFNVRRHKLIYCQLVSVAVEMNNSLFLLFDGTIHTKKVLQTQFGDRKFTWFTNSWNNFCFSFLVSSRYRIVSPETDGTKWYEYEHRNSRRDKKFFQFSLVFFCNWIRTIWWQNVQTKKHLVPIAFGHHSQLNVCSSWENYNKTDVMPKHNKTNTLSSLTKLT